MNEKPDIVLVGTPFLSGAVIPPGLLYTITIIGESLPSSPSLSIALPLTWFTLIAVETALVGERLRLPTDALLGGGILGALVGFGAFALSVGWSFVGFAIAPIAILAIVLGAWVAYERNRRHGETKEPPYGTWRHVFVLLSMPLVAIPLLLLVG